MQVVAAPNAEIPQVQAAQDFKELSDKVANARADSRGKRSAKGQAATTATRDGRVGGGGKSKSPPPPSSRGGGRSRTSAVGNNAGRQRRQPSRGNSSSDSSSQHRRIGRDGSGKSSSSGSSKRSVKREVGKSTREAGDGNLNQEQSRQADAPSEIAPTPPSKEEVAAAGVGTGQSDQQEGRTLPREGSTPEEMEVPDGAVDPVVVGDRQQDDTATTSKEIVLAIGGALDDDAAEASQATETNQQQDDSGVETSGVEASGVEALGVEGALPTSATAATEVKTPLASPRLREDTSRTTMFQDEGCNDPGASSSSTTESVGDRTHPQQQRQNQPKQQSDSSAVALGTTPAISPLPMVPEVHGQNGATTEESTKMSPISPKTSSAGDGVDMDTVEDKEEEGQLTIPMQTMGDDQDGGLGPETGETQPLVSTAVVEFVPTERSLAAYCQV